MFNMSGSEIVVILLLALVVLGPEKLPDAVRRFGKMYGELRRMSTSFQDELRSTLDEPMREMRETADLLREQADFTRTDDDRGPRHPTPSGEKPKSAEMTPVGETGGDDHDNADDHDRESKDDRALESDDRETSDDRHEDSGSDGADTYDTGSDDGDGGDTSGREASA